MLNSTMRASCALIWFWIRANKASSSRSSVASGSVNESLFKAAETFAAKQVATLWHLQLPLPID